MRLFKPGDHVRRKNDNKIMQVIRYVPDKGILSGSSNHRVECSWYDETTGMHCMDVFHQYSLIKAHPYQFFPFGTDFLKGKKI
ncbi:hypothetical protein GCM10028791_37800 [Echinicola sediminis]